jgi:hypothetical protein
MLLEDPDEFELARQIYCECVTHRVDVPGDIPSCAQIKMTTESFHPI